jgi:hypothetical protein
MILRAATRPARRVIEVYPVPEPLAAVVDRALERDTAKRWQGAAAMREALRDAVPLESSPLGRALATTLHGELPPSSGRRRSHGPGSDAPTHFALVAAPSVRPRWERWPPLTGSFVMMVVALCLLGLVFALHSLSGRSTGGGPNVAHGNASTVAAAAGAPLQAGDPPALGVERLVDLPPAATVDLPAPSVPRSAVPASPERPALDSKRAAASAADCNPPFRLDAAGKKRWRPECL